MKSYSEIIKGVIEEEIATGRDRLEVLNEVHRALHTISGQDANPVDCVQWIPIEKIDPNDYNPNSVAKREMGLLYISVKEDGYTQPTVVVYDKDKDKYVIVDGFHRYFVCKTMADIAERNHGCLPCVVIEKTLEQRMAATVRHNRARGSHSIEGMSGLVFGMLNEGQTDEQICHELGLDAEELLKLKYITGFAKLYEDVEFRKSWMTDKQIKIRHEYGKDHDDGLKAE